MKTVWLVTDNCSYNRFRIFKFSDLEDQIIEFNEVGYFDSLLLDHEVKFMYSQDNIRLEEYGHKFESHLLEVIGCLDSIASYQDDVKYFTLDSLKYYQGLIDFIKKYDDKK